MLHDRVGKMKKKQSPSQSTLVQEIYDSLAEQYDEFTKNAAYAVPKWVSQLAGKFTKTSPTVLDLACGNGWIAKTLKASLLQPPEIHGIDISSKMVELCRNSNLYHNVLQADLSHGILGDLEYDLITAFGLMEFLPDCTQILKECHDHLSAGGELWVSFELANEIASTIEIPFKSGILRRYLRSQQEVKRLVHSAGLAILSVESVVGYISPTSNKQIPYLLVQAVRRSPPL